MRMYFEVRAKVLPENTEQEIFIANTLKSQFAQRAKNLKDYSTR
jgi:hypothetical protein